MTIENNGGTAADPGSAAAASGGAAASSSGDGAAAAAAAAAAGASPAASGSETGSNASAAAGTKGGFLDGGDDAGAGGQGDADSAARLDAFTAADGADARKAAWDLLNDAEKAKAAEGLSDDDKKALGFEAKAGDVEAYKDIKAPEGMTVDTALLDKAKAAFADKGLSPEQAQAMVDFYAKDVAGALKEAGEAPYKLWADTQQKWIDTVHSDPELGGDKLQGSRAAAARFIDSVSKTPEESKALRAALTFTGATNNPEIFRAFARAGALLSEGRFVAGKGAAPAPKPSHEVMYGTTGTTVKATE